MRNLVFILLLALLGCSTSKAGSKVRVLELGNLYFTTSRPSMMSKVTFCTSAAFVASDRKTVVGPYYCTDSHKFGSTKLAVFYRKNGRYGICWGQSFKQSHYKSNPESDDFFFSQLPLIIDGKIVTSRNKVKHNCRAIALKGQQIFYLETSGTMTMKEFASSIRELGYENAIYLDSGSYGFGWSRKGINIDLLKSCKFSKTLATLNQNNWIYCK